MSAFLTLGLGDAPYPGLRPFRPDERVIFFGRDQQVDELLERLDRVRFLAVVGASGCGKSSLVRAGLLSALEGGSMISAGPRWHIAEMRPGSQPFLNLARALLAAAALGPAWTAHADAPAFLASALRRGPLGLVEVLREDPRPRRGSLLLLVDQFEEIFRYHQYGDSREARAFVNLLLASAAAEGLPIYVVLTMRSDFLGDCTVFDGLPEAINEGQFLTPRLSRDQSREAIVGPAAVFGCEVEERLVNRILNDIGPDQDQLPLMQHALRRIWTLAAAGPDGRPPDQPDDAAAPLWAATPGMVLTTAAYERCGGLQHALSNHATEAYRDDLTDEERRVAEVLFRCLTERGEAQRDTRRPVPLDEVAQVAGATPETADAMRAVVARVVEVFRRPDRCFLTPAAGVPLDPDTTLDISHESLIRQWDLLREWVAKEAESAATFVRLAETAALWQQGRAGLWGPPDLDNALAWRDQQRPTAAWARRYSDAFEPALEFLDASVEARAARLRAETERAQREKDLLQRRAEAEHALRVEAERFSAEQARAAVKLRRWAGIATAFGLFSLTLAVASILLFLRARWARSDAEAARNVSEQSSYNIQLARAGDLWSTDPTRARELLYDPDLCPPDRRSFTWGYHNRLAYLQLRSDRQTLDPRAGAARSVSLSRDGKLLASAHQDGTIRLWDVATGRLSSILKGHSGPVTSVDFPRSRVEGLSPGPRPEAGKLWLVSGGTDGTVRIWDALTGRQEGRIDHGKPVERVRSYGDDVTVKPIVFCYGGVYRVYDRDGSAEDLHREGELDEKKIVFLDAVAFGYQSRLIVILKNDLNVYFPANPSLDSRVADRPSKFAPLLGQAHRAGITAMDRIEGHPVLATASKDRTVKLWDLGEGKLLRTLEGHTEAVTCVALSADGRLVASGSEDHTVKLWDANTGELRGTLANHTGTINGVQFTPDGRTLASASDDGTVKLWNVTVSPERMTLQGHERQALALAYSPDGKWVASAGGERTIRLWDVATGQLRQIVGGVQPGYVLCLAFSADGKTLASAGYGREIRLWDVVNRVRGVLEDPDGHTQPVRALDVSPDGTMLASASGDGTVKLWDLRSRKLVRTLRGHTGFVNAVDFAPDGTTLASGSYDGTVRLWDVATGQERETLGTPGDGQVLSVQFAPEGKTLASASGFIRSAGGNRGRNEVRLWDVETGQLRSRLRGHTSYVRRVAFSPDGKVIATAGADRTVKLWDAAIGYEQATIEPGFGDALSLAFSPDGHMLAAGGSDGSIKLWEAVPTPIVTPAGTIPDLLGHAWGLALSPDGRVLAAVGKEGTVRLLDARTRDLRALLKGSPSPRQAVAFAPDGSRLATAGADGMIYLWDARSGRPLGVLKGHDGAVRSVAFAPAGDRLASAGSDGTVRIWDASGQAAAPLRTLRGHDRYVNAVAFAEDGRSLASAGYDGTVRVWDVAQGTELRRLTGHEGGQVLGVAYSPDGTMLATAGGEIRSGGSVAGANEIRLWEPTGGKSLRVLRGHTGPVRRVAFSPDGRLLASASLDKTIRVWDRGTGETVLTLEGHNGPVNDVVFSPKGDVLYSIGGDGTVRTWSLEAASAR
jgi:WD40 repeat protein/energy-coupling factor transporter ATP-binding protein EcfA2